MIFEINLIKDRAKQRKRKGLLRIVLYIELFLFLLTHLILLSYYATLSRKVGDIQRNVASLNEDIIFLSGEGVKLSSLNEISGKYSEISSKLLAIDKLMENRILISHKLKGLSKVLPATMWIDRFYVADKKIEENAKEKEAKLISLNGHIMASQQEAFEKVQSFVKDLKNEPLFKKGIDSIELSSISRPKIRSLQETMEFEIECWLVKK